MVPFLFVKQQNSFSFGSHEYITIIFFAKTTYGIISFYGVEWIFGGINFDRLSVNILGEVTLNYGKFITAIVNFLIMALIIFFIMKAVNTLEAQAARLARLGNEQEAPAPTTKICPFCKSEIPIDATRCAHCTSELEQS